MKLPKPSEGGGDFTPVPAGTWPAICYQFVDLGTQQTSWKGQAKEVHQIRLAWELHDEDCVMREGPKAGMPMMIQQTYTWSMFEKAKLRITLEGWRGKKFTDAEIDAFDVRDLLGKPCILNVIHTVREDKVYANIASVSKPPRGMAIPKQINSSIYVSLTPEEFDRGQFDQLPDKLKEKIMDSPEYHQAIGGVRSSAAASKFEDAEIPF